MLDLTKEIKLEPHLRKRYTVARIFLYAVFLIIVLLALDRILFPSLSFTFSFSNINSLKNNLELSNITAKSETLAKGLAVANDAITFDANPSGTFSSATVKFTTDNNSKNIENTPIRIRKSYEAFFYPTGAPIGFRDGTLLVADGVYYIVSDGALRKFSNIALVTRLGYSKNSFLQVSQDDLKYNDPGDDINDIGNYPNDTLFAIGDTYYQLKNQQLYPFVSTKAFFSQFDANQAIIKTADFFSQYELAETSLGFADGTLASLAPSVFILSEGKSYPISNAETFIKMGFDWNNLVQVDSVELGIYEKQRQFTYNQPHPNGTLFFDQRINKYFVIKDEEKHPIESAAVAKTYSKQKPVLADLQENEVGVSCQLKKKLFSSYTYSCDAPLNSFDNFPGTDFQIDAKFKDGAKISNADITFFTSINLGNFNAALSKIKGNVFTNYNIQQQP